MIDRDEAEEHPRADDAGTRVRSVADGPNAIDGFRKLVGELIEHVPSAMFAIDGMGTIFQTNARFESLLGLTRADFVGSILTESLVSETTRDRTRRDLEAVRAGERDALTLELDGIGGTRVVAECDVRRYGRSDSSPWLVTVLRSRIERRDSDARPFGALRYRVRLRADMTFESDEPDFQGEPCHRALYLRDRPCERCPAFDAITSGRATEASWFEGDEDQLVVVRAFPDGLDRARCERALFSPAVADLVLRARIERRIELAKLSPRERDVLAYLRLGRSLEEVASILSISHHTVKFHTANLLQKLGAESRLDLIRILG